MSETMMEKIAQRRKERLEEAIFRLKTIGISDKTEEELKKGNLLMMLDNGSCDFVKLDKYAEFFVGKVSKKRKFPYHVIKSNVHNHVAYIILYVSFDKCDWTDERPEEGCYIRCYVYYPDYIDDKVIQNNMRYIENVNGQMTIEVYQ